jgi:hypothetical protein
MPYDNVVKALYSYEAADSEELSFCEDELLCLLPGGPESWHLAHPLRAADRLGLIPANYVEPVLCLFCSFVVGGCGSDSGDI